MPVSRIIVTALGFAAIVWVLWYFLAPSATGYSPSVTPPQPPAE